MRVKFGKEVLDVSCTNAQSVGDLKKMLAEAHNLRIETVKLMRSGKVLEDDMCIDDPNMTVVMMATKQTTNLEDNTPRHLQTRLIDDLTQKRPKVASSKTKLTLADSRFGIITPLEGLPMRDKAYSILLSLATDRGIVAIMKKYNWNVPTLAELYPEGEVGISEVCVLGLNENKGQRILLRIRTDDLQGFRRYDSMRQVLIHELTHNVWGDHDSNFYQFMRQLQKESIELDWEKASKGKRINGVKGKIEYVDDDEEGDDAKHSEDGPRILDENNSNSIFKILPARMMAGQAALLRLTEEEKEVQDGCGCGSAHVENTRDPKNESADIAEVDNNNCEPVLCGPCGDVEEVEDGAGKDDSPIANTQEHATTNSASVDGASIRRQVRTLCDEAMAMNQQYSDSAYAAEKLKSFSSLLMALLKDSNRGDKDSAAPFEEACDSLTLIQKILGNARDPTKRSLNKSSKVFRKLNEAGAQLLVCIGFVDATEGRLVLRLYDESFAYIANDLMERTIDICREVLESAQTVIV